MPPTYRVSTGGDAGCTRRDPVADPSSDLVNFKFTPVQIEHFS